MGQRYSIVVQLQCMATLMGHGCTTAQLCEERARREYAATCRLWAVVQQEYGKIGFLSYDAAPPMGMKLSDVFFIFPHARMIKAV